MLSCQQTCRSWRIPGLCVTSNNSLIKEFASTPICPITTPWISIVVTSAEALLLRVVDDTLLLLIVSRRGRRGCRTVSSANQLWSMILTSTHRCPFLGPSCMSALPAGLRRHIKRLPNKCYTTYKCLATLCMNPSIKLPTREV